MMIYKYLSFEQFVSLVEKEQLYLTRIDLWPDVREAILLKFILSRLAYGELSYKCKAAQKIKQLIYAQSWTARECESEAMWKIYAAPNGVRIGCEMEDIQHHIEQEMKIRNYNYIALSPQIVEYNTKAIAVKNSIKYDALSKGDIEEALKYKLPAFDFENEIRFGVYSSFLDKNSRNISESYFREINIFTSDVKVINYSFPKSSLKQILLSPEAEEYQRIFFENYCQRWELLCEYRQSNLYGKANKI